MLVHFKDGTTRKMSALMPVGFECKSITLNARDFNQILLLYRNAPLEFRAWLYQFHARFEENRVKFDVADHPTFGKSFEPSNFSGESQSPQNLPGVSNSQDLHGSVQNLAAALKNFGGLLLSKIWGRS